VVGDGSVVVLFGEVGVPAVDVGRGRFRVELDRLTVVGDGLVVVLLFVVGEAAIVIGRNKFRIEADRLIVVGDGAVEILFAGIRDAATVVGKGGWIDPDHLLVAHYRPLVHPADQVAVEAA
jgi:hypothetical protein